MKVYAIGTGSRGLPGCPCSGSFFQAVCRSCGRAKCASFSLSRFAIRSTMSLTVDDRPNAIVRQDKAEPLLRAEHHLDQVYFIHAEVIMQSAAERYGIPCFHKRVLIGNCRDDLLDR